jgi:hypothetical protein
MFYILNNFDLKTSSRSTGTILSYFHFQKNNIVPKNMNLDFQEANYSKPICTKLITPHLIHKKRITTYKFIQFSDVQSLTLLTGFFRSVDWTGPLGPIRSFPAPLCILLEYGFKSSS